jgi:hypothetical protein
MAGGASGQGSIGGATAVTVVVTAAILAALSAPAGCEAPNPAYRRGTAQLDGGDAAPAPLPDSAPPLTPDSAELSDAARVEPPCPPSPDEDGDGVGDACDNCPGQPNPGQEDQLEIAAGLGADGVGDVCDPRPSAGGDSLLFFDGFEGSSLDPGWTGDRSKFALDGGFLIYDSADDDEYAILRRDSAGDVLVLVNFELVRWSAADENRNLWVGVRGDAADNAYRCSVRRDSDGQTMIAFFTFGDISAPASTQALSIDVGSTYRLAARAQGTEMECRVGSSSLIQGSIMSAAGLIEIRARRAAVRLHSAVAYRLGS